MAGDKSSSQESDLSEPELGPVMQQLNQRLEKNPEELEAYLQRAGLWHELQNYPKAFDDYTSYLELSSDPDPEAYFNRAVLREKHLNDLQGAIEDYSQFIKLKPADAKGFAYRGSVYRNSEQSEEKALNDLNRALEIDPNNEDAL